MTIRELQKLCHKIAIKKGFWDTNTEILEKHFAGKNGRNNGEMIALMHSELSEALEELRKPNCNIKKVGEELVDCFIRILDFCGGRNIDFQALLEKKIKKNKKRKYKHGKRF